MSQASFWVGKPHEEGILLWAGYLKDNGDPVAMPPVFNSLSNYVDFEKTIEELKTTEFWASVESIKNSPVFSLDYTYAYYDNCLHVAQKRKGFIPWAKAVKNPSSFENMLNSLPEEDLLF